MTVLDTLYLLFKTNAKDAKADVAALDKQISELSAKGKARDEAESKQLIELRKQRQGLTQELKEQTRQVNELGSSFVKIIEGGAAAATAAFAFQGIKAGILDVTNFNSALNITEKRTGKSVEQLRLLDAAFESAGSRKGGFLQVFNSAFEQLGSNFLDVGNPKALLDKIRAEVMKGQTPGAREGILRRYNLPFDAAGMALMTAPQKEYDAYFEKAAENAKLYADEAQKARDFERAQTSTQQALQTAYTRIADDVLPSLTKGMENLTSIINSISGVSGGATAAGAAGIIGTSLFGKSIVRSLLRGLGMGGAETAGAVGGIGLTGALAAGAAAWGIGSGIGDIITGGRNSLLGMGAGVVSGKILDWKYGAPKRNEDTSQAAYNYWLAQGYSPSQAAALVGNQKGEGWTQGGKAGDNGTAFGIAQWHSPRILDILENTGIDVRTAGLQDQLAAQNWEMSNRYGITPQTLPQDTKAAVSDLVRKYERTDNQTLDIMKRSAYAAESAHSGLSFASSSPLNSVSGGAASIGGDSSFSLKIGDIHVHTQATDADGISKGIGSALTSEFRNAFSNIDDGVAG